MRVAHTRQDGQAMVTVVVAITAIVGMVSLVLDVGSWFRAQRQLQTAADAAALAGVQEMPDQSSATTQATTFADANAASASKSITFPTSGSGNCPSGTGSTDTVNVCLSKPAPGVFSKLYGIASITVHAHAQARVGVPASLKNIAPVAVKSTIACTDSSSGCFDTAKVMTFDESNLTSSAFGLVNLDKRATTALGAGCKTSKPGSSDLVTWIGTGYPNFLDVNLWYCAAVGEKIGPIRDALTDEANKQTVLLFPVFDVADNTNLAFHVVGWSAFVIDAGGVTWTPSTKELRGRFVQYIAHGVSSSPGTPGFGVRAVSLTK